MQGSEPCHESSTLSLAAMNFNNLWLHLADETTPQCVTSHLERARAFFRRPGVMGHIKWPRAATLVYEDRTIQTMCHRNGMVFDLPDWPVRHDKKGTAALVLWYIDKVPADMKFVIVAGYHSDGTLLTKDLYKVQDVSVIADKEETTLLLLAEQLIHRDYDPERRSICHAIAATPSESAHYHLAQRPGAGG